LTRLHKYEHYRKPVPYLGDMMHYRPLPIRHLGGRVSPVPAGFTPLSKTTLP